MYPKQEGLAFLLSNMQCWEIREVFLVICCQKINRQKNILKNLSFCKNVNIITVTYKLIYDARLSTRIKTDELAKAWKGRRQKKAQKNRSKNLMQTLYVRKYIFVRNAFIYPQCHSDHPRGFILSPSSYNKRNTSVLCLFCPFSIINLTKKCW